ncbi:serine acetyltransferase [Lactonifactor sp. BIOML-A3]|uniref:serine O-acetyltransferase n=1 Tax=unclassified Lactonifactor TaxID=2636670 RepID=UPI0012AFF952|nr:MULTISPECIES: serine acetyltransferase [unclassified Lactonifactor]MSA01737.1 serine acetyltransferase [Lactonifactor sp. BIOML-A5]MSA08735.1 serine acetyltransferase [Lactonifactor sp. BIOML-A4]MSA13869.1 serine acetyltransferase [Lactonifactor sp. BIOML-A3]MSA17110.1 serine acetyltransferase [Lactonifactor sp. BIOML-A2]MSA37789.1 serine acetyltransferase [Lactonifactor sp. BIOML-A1]
MIGTKEELLEYLAADKKALNRRSKRPAFNDVIWKYEILLRKCEYYGNKNGVIAKLFGTFYRYRRFKLGLKCNFTISPNTVGKGLCISHVGPIVISNFATIGENCRIHVGVNIGADFRNGSEAPCIGNNVYIGPGAKIYGGISIADGIAIGANSVVNKDFSEPNISIGGVPAKKISDRGTKGVLF